MSKKSLMTSAEVTAEFLGSSFWRIARYFAELQEHAPDRLPVVAKLVKIGRRKAYHYARIYRAFSNLGVDEERLDLIGWTKLALLSEHINSSNCDYLLDLAETSTVRELTLLLRDELPVPGERCVILYLEPTDYEVFEKAVLTFGGSKTGRGLVNKEEALLKALTKSLEA